MLETTLLLAALQLAGPQLTGSALGLEQQFGPVGPLEPALVVLEERYDTRELVLQARRLPRAERRAFVMERLVPFAAESQATLLEHVAELEQLGHARAPRSLWNVNALRVELSADGFAELEQFPGVLDVKWDPNLPSEETADGAALQALTFTSLPAANGFEGGLPSWIELSSSGAGVAEVTGAHGPSSGAGHLVLSGDGQARALIGLNLAGVAGARMEFTAKTFGDTPEDTGLYLSSPGGEVFQLSTFASSKASRRYRIDLGAFYKAAGEAPSATSYLEFIWTGSGSAPNAGLAIDELVITADTLPSVNATPNLWKVGAPRAWELGFDGSDVLLLSIDDGAANNHPDLANRIWSNPGEIPGNGTDDDGNGYVDDVWGWDFRDGDNWPYDIGHGTHVAGIAVGDGSSTGEITGVAPGATLAVARISGEGALLESYQYAIIIGADAITSSHTLKLESNPTYMLFRTAMEVELAAGIARANSIGNQGLDAFGPVFTIPWNIATPGNCPGPWIHPQQVEGGLGSVIAVSGVFTSGDGLYTPSGYGPAAWEDVQWTKPSYDKAQDQAQWDYLWFFNQLPGLLKPDLASYTGVKTLAGSGSFIDFFSGTSAATPHVGGALAVLLDANPNLLPRQLSQVLQESAWDLGDAGKDVRFGAGRMDLEEAVRRVLGTVTSFPSDPAAGGAVTLEVAGPQGAPWLLFFSGLKTDLLLPEGLYLGLGVPNYYTAAAHSGVDAPTQLNVTLPPALVAGTDVHLQLLTVPTSGPLAGALVTSLVETIDVQ
ncbi:MAG: S8 family serine peptidase [Planctomycetota bacterium]|jgi:subtilisin family serine protease